MITNQKCGELKVRLVNGKVIGDGIDYETYSRQADGVVRGHPNFVMGRGELMEFARCNHRWLMGIDSEDTKFTEWGKLLDCLLLTPERFDDAFAVCPETYTNDKGEEKEWTFAAKVCKAWREEHEGKQIVKHEPHQQALNAAKFALGQPAIASLIECSRKQVMVVATYQDEATGREVPLRALIDLLPDANHPDFGKTIADLKTTTDASEFEWTKKVYKTNTHAQAALYLDLYVAATGEDRCEMQHIVQESMPPWETVLWPLSADFVDLGRGQYLNALERYCQCLTTGKWPGYSSGGKWITPLPYMLNT